MYRDLRNYENLIKIIFEGVGEFDIPEIEPIEVEDSEFIGFHEVNQCKDPKGKAVHFFLDDYRFTRVWSNPDSYLEKLLKFNFVLSQDFSLYSDYPKVMQVYNHYRKHWLGAYWQLNGINVIPTICWSEPDSFAWCFDGEPKNSVVAVSSVGTQCNKDSKIAFLTGYDEIRLHSEMVFL